jgi:Secretion system C-terminal sorting domain
MKKLFLIPFMTFWAMFANAQNIATAVNTSNIPNIGEYSTTVGIFTSVLNNVANNEMLYSIQTFKAIGKGTSTLLINNTPESIENIQNNLINSVSIYPNPFTTNATIVVNTQGQVYIGTMNLMVYDMFGREVQQSEITNLKGEINRGNLADGMYFYKVTYGNQTISKGKFIIQ